MSPGADPATPDPGIQPHTPDRSWGYAAPVGGRRDAGGQRSGTPGPFSWVSQLLLILGLLQRDDHTPDGKVNVTQISHLVQVLLLMFAKDLLIVDHLHLLLRGQESGMWQGNS